MPVDRFASVSVTDKGREVGDGAQIEVRHAEVTDTTKPIPPVKVSTQIEARDAEVTDATDPIPRVKVSAHIDNGQAEDAASTGDVVATNPDAEPFSRPFSEGEDVAVIHPPLNEGEDVGRNSPSVAQGSATDFHEAESVNVSGEAAHKGDAASAISADVVRVKDVIPPPFRRTAVQSRRIVPIQSVSRADLKTDILSADETKHVHQAGVNGAHSMTGEILFGGGDELPSNVEEDVHTASMVDSLEGWSTLDDASGNNNGELAVCTIIHICDGRD
ncbi:hypothetical protein A0H81_07113 [Grifola frondosa]|uniref:Uncharacterized protein n=1 Tax=Grifola frondosa TaxID=5627 RepID=A0A1C7M997_GRIFR|nr:hypothetical protein A0H81_07113 [Grifola frondosa]